MDKLFLQNGDSVDSPWEVIESDNINSSLSKNTDVSKAKRLKINVKSEICYQGQTHGHPAFLVKKELGKKLVEQNSEYRDVLRPYLTADQMLRKIDSSPNRYVIDFQLNIYVLHKFA